MNGPEREDELEAFLAGRLNLRARFRDSRDLEPPPELDHLVLTRARQAIERVPEPAPYPAAPWALPATLAVTLVLTIAVGLHFWLAGQETTAVRPETDAPPVQPMTADSDAGTAPDADAAPDAGMTAGRPDLSGLRLMSPADAPRTASQAQPGSTGTAASDADARSAADAEPGGEQRREPVAWLRLIERLQTQGQTAAAEREWREFRKVYPDYPVPGSEGPTK